MNTDSIKADLEYLEDLYSKCLVELEDIGNLTQDEIDVKIAWLATIQHQIDKKTNTLVEIEKVKIERSKTRTDKVKAKTDRRREKAEEKRKKLDPNGVMKVVATAASMAVIGFVELKGNGYLNERLLKKADDFMKN